MLEYVFTYKYSWFIIKCIYVMIIYRGIMDKFEIRDTRWFLEQQEGAIFIPFYHFHLFTSIQSFIFNFVREMTYKEF